MTSKNKRRLFLAIPADNEVIALIGELKIKYPAIEFLKWVKTENLHITVLFLGSIEESKLPMIITAVQEVLINQPAFELTIDAVTIKPSLNRPVMIWLQYQQNQEFTKIHNKLKKELSEFAETEERNQIPHITLARTKNKQMIPQHNVKEKPLLKVNKIELWESFTKPKGAEYINIKTFNLK